MSETVPNKILINIYSSLPVKHTYKMGETREERWKKQSKEEGGEGRREGKRKGSPSTVIFQ